MNTFAPIPPRPFFRLPLLKAIACGIAVGFLSNVAAEENPVAPAENTPLSQGAASAPVHEAPAVPMKARESSSPATKNDTFLGGKPETVAETATRPSTDHELLLTNIIHEFNESVRSKNFADAEAKLNVLRALLPEKSLTLLRMRAWYAMSSENTSEAKKLYRQLLSRITDDENAGINLAILEARDGRMDEAVRILSDLSNRGVSSEQLDTVKRAFGQTVSEGY